MASLNLTEVSSSMGSQDLGNGGKVPWKAGRQRVSGQSIFLTPKSSVYMKREMAP